MTKILDSGKRKEFETGAVRDIQEGKGRYDLLPLEVIAELYTFPLSEKVEWQRIYVMIGRFLRDGGVNRLHYALESFIMNEYGKLETAIKELAIHFENGAIKYGERNWEKGIPISNYINSALRHFNKYMGGETDERHDRAFMWNITCAIWTHDNLPEMIDIKSKEGECY